MPLDLLLALIGFAFVTSITPGPNNMMLLTSGVNFGFRRTVPHMLGIGIGFTLMVALIGLGLGQIFERYPLLYSILKYVGAVYMLWLAWGIANSGPVDEGEVRGKPMSFLQAAAFQWVNPKAWVMGVGAIATYTRPENYVATVLFVALVFGVVNIPCVGSWAAFGSAMRHLLRDPRIVRWFNITMAVLLVASLWPVLAEFIR
ncbi:MAG: LysE family amino acid efflux [Beijerinckiaceae bacterium]|nr:MAG: LysE family amino acid efflux [Beijerinckiaceae bacterium]